MTAGPVVNDIPRRPSLEKATSQYQLHPLPKTGIATPSNGMFPGASILRTEQYIGMGFDTKLEKKLASLAEHVRTPSARKPKDAPEPTVRELTMTLYEIHNVF
ncbi:hypothetical protein HK103_005063 [Boothiomyces macroporosus]|uniref:Uncharacterized protein n=1 Tax=Boothiomyces macroporosus TaxID=261099 RepID=A0AAD5UG98_9FUNG|nr:hypothetical protein HK103_005063 [Boothiomyces macroporosus]